MTLPKWFEPKITFGNVLTILAMLGALFAFAQGYGALAKTVEQHGIELTNIKADTLPAVNRRLDALADTVAQDRLFVRETLAEVKTDVNYLRRSEEERRRQEVSR